MAQMGTVPVTREDVLHTQHADSPPVGPQLAGPEPIEAPFHELLAHPSKWSAPRGMTPTSVVIHCTAATNPARNTAEFFASSASSGSTQAVADDNEGYTCVPDDAVCAGAPPLNQEGLHIEQPGLATWSRATWLGHDLQLRRVAYHVALWCRTYGIPIVRLTANDLRAQGERARGITDHAAITAAFGQSTHTDPGPNYPWDVFLSYTANYHEGGDMALTPEQQDYLIGMIRFNKRTGAPPDTAPEETRKGFDDSKSRWDQAMENPPGGKPTKPFDATITPK